MQSVMQTIEPGEVDEPALKKAKVGVTDLTRVGDPPKERTPEEIAKEENDKIIKRQSSASTCAHLQLVGSQSLLLIISFLAPRS